MKSCLDIKCARTTPVTAKGHRGGTPLRASEPRIPQVLASEFLHSSPVSGEKERPKDEAAGESGASDSDPILSHLPFFKLFIATSSACRLLVSKTGRLIRPQIHFNLIKEGGNSCPLSMGRA